MRLRDLTGQRFGRLTVLERARNTESGRVVWLCRCTCGTVVEAPAQSLTRGYAKSCGCTRAGRKEAPPPPPDSCPYNAGVRCPEREDCPRCGWNPRRSKLRSLRFPPEG